MTVDQIPPEDRPALAVEPAPEATESSPELDPSAAPDTTIADGAAAPATETAGEPSRAPGARPDDGAPAFEHAPPTSEKDAVREKLLGQFEQWLDRMLAEEPPPDGVPHAIMMAAAQSAENPAASAADLYTLFSALTALTGEIRLQGRAFKQLAGAMGPSFAQLAGQLDALRAAQAQATDEIRVLAQTAQADVDQHNESHLPSAKEVLAVLFDMVDRLERGMQNLDKAQLTTAAAPKTSWWRRAAAPAADPAAAVNAMREGYRLTYSRLDAALRQWGISRVGKAGEMFDPSCMVAVDVQTAQNVPDGTVLAVYRSGYTTHDEILETAQVQVARAGEPKNG